MLSYDDVAAEFDMPDADMILAAVVIWLPYFDHYALPEGNQEVLNAMETLVTRVGLTRSPLRTCIRDDNDNDRRRGNLHRNRCQRSHANRRLPHAR